MASAMRSFTLLPGLKASTFTKTSAAPVFIRLIRTSGVLPIRSAMLA